MTAPLQPQQLLAHMQDMGVSAATIQHPALRTVADSKNHRPDVAGGFTKNLFLRNHKKQHWLFTLDEDARFDLKRAAQFLQAKRFSFASPERLMTYLGVIPGAVSPLALINDSECEVSFYIDKSLLRHQYLHFHPLDNTMTTTLLTTDFIRFIESLGHQVNELDVSDVRPET